MNSSQRVQKVLLSMPRLFFAGLAMLLMITLGFALTVGNAQGSADKAAQAPGFGSHGMAVFGGRDGLYASHLPMFHAPHDAQVVLRFHLVDAQVDARLRARLALRPQLWTLEPEHFDLLRLQPGNARPLKQFTARLVQGHFERGGTERFAGQTVVVDEVLLFNRLHSHVASGADPAHSAGRYLLLGAGREFFAVKEIDRRPDFDTIIAMKPLPHAEHTVGGKPPRTLVRHFTLPTDDLKTPTRPSLQAALQAQGEKILKVGKTLYFETDELK